MPWNQARVFNTRIRRNIKLAECPSFGKSIFAYAPTCHGAEDYLALAMEVLGESMPTVVSAKVKVSEPEALAKEAPSFANASGSDSDMLKS